MKIVIETNVLVAILKSRHGASYTEGYLKERADRAGLKKFRSVLNKVPNIDPEEYDKIET